jgi:hypothetical integral membrane protein (TIGR02206 family)
VRRGHFAAFQIHGLMQNFFSFDYRGPAFVLFGPAHLAALATIVLLNLALTSLKNAPARAKHAVRLTLAGALWAGEIAWNAWNVAVGTWSIQTMLPLNMCTVFIWLSGFMLAFKNFRIYEFAYFLGIGAAVHYLATPDLGRFGFPHFRFFQTFLTHGLLVTAPIYMTIVEGFRPTWKSLGRVVLWVNIYMAVIYALNLSLGSDYLDLNGKPGTPSLLDLLPPWPYYILFMELIGLLTFALLYLPFFLGDWRSRTTQQREGRGGTPRRV